MSLIRKIEPLVENIIIGLLFLWIGFHIFYSFDESFFGIIGVICLFWGGVKIILGLIVYGVFFWTLLFSNDSFIPFEQKKIIDKVLTKVRRDIKSNKIKTATDRLHGLIFNYPNNLILKYELSRLYLAQGDLINAGRYIYLKPDQNEEERLNVDHFTNSLGNNSFQVLKRITEPSKIDIEIIKKSKNKISKLVEQVKIESEKSSWIVKDYLFYLEKINIPFYKKIMNEQKDILIHIIVLIILFCLTVILK